MLFRSSRKALNEVLQKHLNAGGERISGNPFRVGDKIVNTRNGFFPTVPGPGHNEPETFVANGELARVAAVDHKVTTAQLDYPARTIKIPHGEGGPSWELGYALSVHKSQGSEWSIVLQVLDEYSGAKMVCSREWLYTALSRFTVACFLVGRLTTAAAMIRRVALDKRKPFLEELIQQ